MPACGLHSERWIAVGSINSPCWLDSRVIGMLTREGIVSFLSAVQEFQT